MQLIFWAILAFQGGLAALGVSEPDVKRDVVWSLTQSRVPVYKAAKVLRAADGAARAALVKGVLAWAKAYTESQAFKADYAKQRDSNRPAPPKSQGSVDEQLTKQKAERQKNLAEMKKSLEQMTPDMRKSMEPVIKQMEEQNAKMDQDPQMAALMRQGLETQGQSDQKSYQERLQKFEARYPADPKVLIAQRLREFMDLSGTVDFGAQLSQAGTRMRFVNPQYESKPENWKLCFRAGKEPVEAARAFASSWLKELQAR